MKTLNWKVITLIIIDVGLFFTFLAIKWSNTILKVCTMTLLIIGVLILLLLFFRKDSSTDGETV